MRILGVDPALTRTGYGVIDTQSNGFTLIKAGVITTKSSTELIARLNKIFDEIVNVLIEFRPEVMVIEKVFVHSAHPTTAFVLGQARGVICLAAAKAGIPLFEYAATQVKKAISGTGHASKEQIQRIIVSQLGMKLTPKFLDITDALALAMAYKYFEKAEKIKKFLQNK